MFQQKHQQRSYRSTNSSTSNTYCKDHNPNDDTIGRRGRKIKICCDNLVSVVYRIVVIIVITGGGGGGGGGGGVSKSTTKYNCDGIGIGIGVVVVHAFYSSFSVYPSHKKNINNHCNKITACKELHRCYYHQKYLYNPTYASDCLENSRNQRPIKSKVLSFARGLSPSLHSTRVSDKNDDHENSRVDLSGSQLPIVEVINNNGVQISKESAIIINPTNEEQQRRQKAITENCITIFKNDNIANSPTTSKVDTILIRLTNLFPFFVVGAAVLGLYKPSLLLWVNTGNYISIMLGCVMCGTGLTLDTTDFTSVFQKNFFSIPLGVACQYLIMPLAAYIVGMFLLLPLSSHGGAITTGSSNAIGQELFLGLVLVGCCPGGTASNLVSLIANANVALSVLLTTASTFIAVFMTPLLVKTSMNLLQLSRAKLLLPATAGSATAAAAAVTTSTIPPSVVSVSGSALVSATAKVVLFPVVIGMFLKRYGPEKFTNVVKRYTPLASVVLVSLICGGVVAQNAALLLLVPSSSSSLITTGTGASSTLLGSILHNGFGGSAIVPRVLASVLLLHSIGFLAGYIIPRYIFRQTETTSRTISIEVGMQNSALAVVLARSIFVTVTSATSLSTLPGALSATVHSCLGSILAAFWRVQQPEPSIDSDGSGMLPMIQRSSDNEQTKRGPEPEFFI